MIIFYTQTEKTTPVVSFKINSCNSSCSSNCGIKPKTKCCNKYKKKGINCKRCPLSIGLKAVS